MKAVQLWLCAALLGCGQTAGSLSNSDSVAEEQSAARVVCTTLNAHTVCQADQACISHRCQAAAACANTSDCVTGMQCLQNLCKTPRPCHLGQCAEGFVCDRDQLCQEREDGKACAADADCGSLYYCDTSTSPGACTLGCRSDAECEAPLSQCHLGSHLCIDPLAPAACLEDIDCQTGSYCSSQDPTQLGVCTPGCTKDEHCDPASVCNAGVCEASECGADIDCAPGETCDLATLQCVSGTPKFTFCTYDTDCDPVCGTTDNALRCAGFAKSDKVCDINLLQQTGDQVNGTHSGVCRDRCIIAPLIGEIIPCPNGQTCVSNEATFNTTDPALFCGFSPTGGYSACY